MSEQRRYEARYRVEVPLRLKHRGALLDVLTANVSFRGLFLVTDQEIPERQLVALEGELPPDQTPFRCNAMAVFRISPGSPGEHGRDAGVGMQLYGLAGAHKRTWERFVNYAKEHEPTQRLASEPGQTCPTPVVLRVRPRDLGELQDICNREATDGELFVETGDGLAVGTELSLEIEHPENGLEFAQISVVRRAENAPVRGVGVQFVNMDARRRAELEEFLFSDIPLLDDDIELIVEDD